MNEASHLYICAVAMRLGITSIEVIFAGYGDSGSVEEIRIEGIDVEALKKLAVTPEVTQVQWREPNDKICTTEYRPRDVIANMHEWIERWCNHHATDDDRITWDWYNNDGGGGTITFYPMEGRFEVSGYYNETVQTGIKFAPSGGPDDDIEIIGIKFAPAPEEENADG